MTPLTTARSVLQAHGYICGDTDDGGFRFCGPLGCGRVDVVHGGRMRLGLDVSAAADDPRRLARISSHPGPARITLRRRAPVAERACEATALGEALIGLVGALRPADPAEATVVDVRVGVLTAGAPVVTAPVFLRLGEPDCDVVGRARATFLLIANAHLRSGKGGWINGPGLAVDPQASDRAHLQQELLDVGHGLAALGDADLAASYLELNGLRTTSLTRVRSWDANTEGGCP